MNNDLLALALDELDALGDDAAVHIYPADLEKCGRSECTATVFSVRVGNPDGEKSVPLFSRAQIIAALESAKSKVGAPAGLLLADLHHIRALAHMGSSLSQIVDVVDRRFAAIAAAQSITKEPGSTK